MLPPRIGVLLVVAALQPAATASAQSECGSPLAFPAGATCQGGANDGQPCYVHADIDNYGCPGGTCVPSAGGGRASWYAAVEVNACGIPLEDPSTALVAAVAEHLWDDSAVCGRCARVNGPLGTVTVQLTDLCPVLGNEALCGGDAAHLDLSESAFAAVADPWRGLTYVAWEVVPCPVDGTIRAETVEGSNQWWMALRPLEHRNGVGGLEVRESGATAWVAGTRDAANRFILESASGWSFPLGLRLTDVAGATVTSVTDIPGATAAILDTGVQFPPCGLIFADDFESADFGGWSATLP